METVLFFYNILIVIAFAFCCIDYFVLYYKHKDKSQLFISAVFFLFFFDNLLLYMNEFLPGFMQDYALHAASYEYASNILGLFIILSYRFTIISLEQTSVKSKEAFLWGIVMIMTLSTSTLLDKTAFLTINDLVLGFAGIGVFVHAFFRCKKMDGFPRRAFVTNIGPSFLMASSLIEVSVLIEKVLANSGIHILNKHRYLSIELLSIFYVVTAIWFLINSHIRAEKAEENIAVEDEDALVKEFSDAYGLTQREKEILAYLIQGNSNAEICKAACISEGTVKTHTHNIYSKLDIRNRIQLGIKFRDFQKIK